MSTHLMWFLLAEYVLLALVCAVENRYVLALYWASAATLNLAVLFMNK